MVQEQNKEHEARFGKPQSRFFGRSRVPPGVELSSLEAKDGPQAAMEKMSADTLRPTAPELQPSWPPGDGNTKTGPPYWNRLPPIANGSWGPLRQMPLVANGSVAPGAENMLDRDLPINTPAAPRAMKAQLATLSEAPAAGAARTTQVYVESIPSDHPLPHPTVSGDAEQAKPPLAPAPRARGYSLPDRWTGDARWTNSKTWLSDPEQMRHAFVRMRERIHYIGAADSPFLPKTVFEYAGFEAEMKLLEANKMCRRIKLIEEDARARRATEPYMASVAAIRDMADALAWPTDGRSEVLAQPGPVFGRSAGPTLKEYEVEWPVLAELKVAGDDRQKAGILPRTLPVPRMNRPDPQHFPDIPRYVWEGRDVPNEFREVIGSRWDWLPPHEQARLRAEPAEETNVSDTSLWMVELIHAIEEFADEADMPGGCRWFK